MKTPPVASLEKSRELAKFVKLKTYFCWIKCSKYLFGDKYIIAKKITQYLYFTADSDITVSGSEVTDVIPAPLAEELSDYVYSIRKESFFMYHNAGNYLLQYSMSQGNYNNEKLSDCLIDYIVENKVIEVEDGEIK